MSVCIYKKVYKKVYSIQKSVAVLFHNTTGMVRIILIRCGCF